MKTERPKTLISLSKEARAKLEQLAQEHRGNMTATVEHLLLRSAFTPAVEKGIAAYQAANHCSRHDALQDILSQGLAASPQCKDSVSRRS